MIAAIGTMILTFEFWWGHSADAVPLGCLPVRSEDERSSLKTGGTQISSVPVVWLTEEMIEHSTFSARVGTHRRRHLRLCGMPQGAERLLVRQGTDQD